ncbi:hypothetical protein vseg_017154 [Gypsophila vaccaria]
MRRVIEILHFCTHEISGGLSLKLDSETNTEQETTDAGRLSNANIRDDISWQSKNIKSEDQSWIIQQAVSSFYLHTTSEYMIW